MSIEILAFGNPLAAVSTDVPASRCSHKLDQVDATTLGELLARCRAEVIALVDLSTGIDMRKVAEITLPDRDDVLLFPYSADGEVAAVWGSLPVEPAVLLEPPERHAVIVFRRHVLVKVAPCRAVKHPMWDWLVRAVRSGVSLKWCDRVAIEAPHTPDPRLPALVPRRPAAEVAWLHEAIDQFDAERALGGLNSAADGVAVKAGLFQWHDWLDESHSLAQSVQGQGRHAAGDYWHAIMHRREPDWSNSKYWFRRVGRHPIFGELATAAERRLAEDAETETVVSWADRLGVPDRWDPFAFVDLCAEAVRTRESALMRFAQQVQREEMIRLLAATCADALGG